MAGLFQIKNAAMPKHGGGFFFQIGSPQERSPLVERTLTRISIASNSLGHGKFLSFAYLLYVGPLAKAGEQIRVPINQSVG